MDYETKSMVEDYLIKQNAFAFMHQNQNKDIMNTYSSIVPSEMTNREIQHMCTELQTAINWGMTEARIKLPNGTEYDVPTSNLPDYQEAHQTETGGRTNS